MQYILVNYVRAASATELEIKTVKGAYLDLITTQSFFFFVYSNCLLEGRRLWGFPPGFHT